VLAGRLGVRSTTSRPSGVLSPFERVSEILFGVIMALTITGALSVAQASEQQTRALFVGAMGCNVAWGAVDAVMYVLDAIFGRSRRALLAQAIEGADDAKTTELLAEAFGDPLAHALSKGEVSALRSRILSRPDLTASPGLAAQDLVGAAAVFLLVVASTFPVALPYLVVRDAALAKGISRGLSLALLFLCGFAMGRFSGLKPVPVGFAMLGIGVVLVALVMALGG